MTEAGRTKKVLQVGSSLPRLLRRPRLSFMHLIHLLLSGFTGTFVTAIPLLVEFVVITAVLPSAPICHLLQLSSSRSTWRCSLASRKSPTRATLPVVLHWRRRSLRGPVHGIHQWFADVLVSSPRRRRSRQSRNWRCRRGICRTHRCRFSRCCSRRSRRTAVVAATAVAAAVAPAAVVATSVVTTTVVAAVALTAGVEIAAVVTAAEAETSLWSPQWP